MTLPLGPRIRSGGTGVGVEQQTQYVISKIETFRTFDVLKRLATNDAMAIL